MARRIKRPSPAMVVALIALFVSVGGVSYAASKIGTNDIKRGAVTKPKIAKKAVTTGKLDRQAVKGGKIADAAVKTGKIADQAVQFGNIQDLAIGTDKLSTGAVTSDKIAGGSVNSTKVDGSIVTADTVGVPLAGANIGSDGAVRQFFNRVGGAPTVDHTAGTGVYNITFPGLDGKVLNSGSVSMGSIQSAAFGGQLTISSSGGNPRIRTANGAGAATDLSFEYVVIQPSP
jgi:trimeric autotransporter adhesin